MTLTADITNLNANDRNCDLTIQITGISLRDAEEILQQIQAYLPSHVTAGKSMKDQVIEIAKSPHIYRASGTPNKVMFVKAYRQITGAGLKDACDWVDDYFTAEELGYDN